MSDQHFAYDCSKPLIREVRYKNARPLVHPDKQSPITNTGPSAWQPGERDRYREVCPPGCVDFEVVQASPGETAFRHSGWIHTRRKILTAMQRANVPAKRLARITNCGSNAWVYQCPQTGECAVEANHCGDRLCSACARARSGVIAAQLAAAMKGKEMRHVVLTLRHSAMPLYDQITRIYQCFANLRRHNAWKRHVTGGAAFCEIKLGRSGAWHVHLHLLTEGDYFPHSVLSAAWLVATGDSEIVWIGSVPEVGKIAGYVTKYVTKGIDQTVIDAGPKLDEAILALRGRRMCLTWGTWRGIDLRPPIAPKEGWKILGRLEYFIVKAAHGDLWSIKTLAALKGGDSGSSDDKNGIQSSGNPDG